MDSFKARKTHILTQLGAEVYTDKSPKGSVDEPIRHLIDFVNHLDHFVTTSSCSGRITLFSHEVGRPKGGKWNLISHARVTEDDVFQAVYDFNVRANSSESVDRELVFRFEPFILAVETDGLESASELLKVARSAGFRESGITSVGKRCMLSIRSSTRLEAPVAFHHCTNSGECEHKESGLLHVNSGDCEHKDSGMLVPDSYLSYLTRTANAKFDQNRQRSDKLLQMLKNAFAGDFHSEANDLESSTASPKLHVAALCDRQKRLLASLESLSISPNSLPNISTSSVDGSHSVGWALRVDKLCVKSSKDALKQRKWLDHTRRICQAENYSGCFHLPLTVEGAFHCQLASASQLVEWFGADSIVVELARTPRCVSNKLHSSSPQSRLRAVLTEFLSEHVSPAESGRLLSHVQTTRLRWEKLGDCVLLGRGAFSEWPQKFTCAGSPLWTGVASALGAKRVARQQEIDPGLKRRSRVQMLLGDDGWVEHKENSIFYCFDVTKCMFSSGNGTEKMRMARICKPGEVVVDLYAGIGYFSLPFLIHGKVKHLYAFEWNEDAIHALKHNIRANKIDTSRVTIFEGDNRITSETLRNVADRVNLGLIPSSEDGWEPAVRALKRAGGTLHVHANVSQSDEREWAEGMRKKLAEISRKYDRSWELTVVHIEKVKRYAPRVNHIVVDVECKRVHD
eukprot:114549_1